MTLRLTPAVLSAVVLLSACGGPEAPDPAQDISRAYSEQDFECLREAIYFEAQASNARGQHAVADVIKNRADDPRFPGSICGVIADGCQFSYRCDGQPESFPDKIKFTNASKIAEEALEEPEEDITDGALFFHAQWMPPGWFATLRRIGEFGGNIFYR
ncbi:MAG: cell wall hydrolase [Pseudomonadota bacterium]